MAGTSVRRPLPALVFILLLSLLTGLVWWRVLHRPDADAGGAPTSSSVPCSPSTAQARPWPKPSTVTLTVLNATDRNGLAHTVAGQLKDRGFKIGPIGNDTSGGATSTQVRYGSDSVTAARLVQLYLPGARLVAVAGSRKTVVVSVGNSYKQLASNKQVAKGRATPAPSC